MLQAPMVGWEVNLWGADHGIP